MDINKSVLLCQHSRLLVWVRLFPHCIYCKSTTCVA